MMEIQRVREAYKKLKGSVFYDKPLAYLRTRLVEYEKDDLEEKLNHVAELLENDQKWDEFEKEIGDSISVLSFPKRVLYADEDDGETNSLILSNTHASKTLFDDYNDFIDMKVEGFLVGILWIIEIGYNIDIRLSETCYGNRLTDNLKLGGERVTASPNLFKPYFHQYENWQKHGLNKAEEYLAHGEDSIVISMLDLKKFYYSVNLSKQFFDQITGDESLSGYQKRINHAVYRIITNYSTKRKSKRTVLPIGFHPSGILANAYLAKLDEVLGADPRTIYYGRYVDDIMWISTVQLDSKRIKNEGIQSVAERMINYLKNNRIITDDVGEYRLQDDNNLIIQQNKLRFFYLDNQGGTDLLRRIKTDINQNSSEFNYLPEKYAADYSTDLFQIVREESINKMKGITKVGLDKYTLSKYLGKSILMSEYTSEEEVSQFIDCLSHLLDDKEIISNYLTWESVLNYYVKNNRLDETVRFTARIVDAIKNFSGSVERKGTIWDRGAKKRIRESLVYFYWSCIARSLSVVWGKSVLQAIDEICIQLNRVSKNINYSPTALIKLRKGYIFTRMYNKNIVPVSVDFLIKRFRFADLKITRNITHFDDIISKRSPNEKMIARQSKGEYYYTPYVISPFEIGYAFLLEQILDGESLLEFYGSYIELLHKKYARNFMKESSSELKNSFQMYEQAIKVEFKTKDVIRTAVANVRMDEKELDLILDGIKWDRSNRGSEIEELVNTAIRNKADVLVMPEAYVPLQFLPLLEKKAANNKMMMIFGIEHVVCKNLVWNLTCALIPFEIKNVKYVLPLFRQKKYLSPYERDIIAKRHLQKAPDNPNVVCNWAGFNFATYCCYELTSIKDRCEFLGDVDIVFGIEWNKDIKYFSNIMESLSRDMYCYCVQANMSDYGDSRIIAPAHGHKMDIMHVKGGKNATVLIEDIDLNMLKASRTDDKKQNDYGYAKLPAGWDK